MFVFVIVRIFQIFFSSRYTSRETIIMIMIIFKKNIIFILGFYVFFFLRGLWKILKSIIVRPPALIDVIEGVGNPLLLQHSVPLFTQEQRLATA